MTAENIVIAVGTTPARPADVEFDGRRVLDSDSMLQLERIPAHDDRRRRGVIGIEYASVFAAIGVRGDGDRDAGLGCSRSSTPRSSRRCSTTCASCASRCRFSETVTAVTEATTAAS